MSALQPVIGQVTFNSEGTEKGRFHSRKLHVPSNSSGLTIGRGYDMRFKSKSKIKNDLLFSGLSAKQAELLSNASGLSGQSAKNFIEKNSLGDFEITQQSQLKLFNISYAEEESEAKRLCSKPDVVEKYGKCDWSSLNPAIKEILVDLKFRGDYTGSTRKIIQKHVSNNDINGLLSVLSERKNWLNPLVPQDRFQRRIQFLKSKILNQF